jgi:hypothetical protein
VVRFPSKKSGIANEDLENPLEKRDTRHYNHQANQEGGNLLGKTRKGLSMKQLQRCCAAVCLLLLGACGIEGKMDKTNEKMDATLKQSQEISNISEDLYGDLRQGDSWEHRAAAFERMKAAPTLKEKKTFAGPYFSGFEFQLWKNSRGDDPARREALYRCAIDEFLGPLATLMLPDSYDINVEFPKPGATANPNAANLQALAIALHVLNENQDSRKRADGNYPVVSMLDVIVSGLRHAPAVESGAEVIDALPPYVQAVLGDAPTLTYLLNVRYNLYLYISMKKLLNGRPFTGAIWDPEINKLSTASINILPEWLNRALEIKTLMTGEMAKAGVSLASAESVLGMFLYMKPVATDVEIMSWGSQLTSRQEKIAAIEQLVRKLKN